MTQVLQVHNFLAKQGLPLVERVEYENARWYRTPGETDPANYFASVTNILSVAQPKPLTEYFKRTSYRKQTEQLEDAAKLGTKIHELAERDLQGETIPEADLKFEYEIIKGKDIPATINLKDWYARWQKLKLDKQITATALEVPVVNQRYGYAGTLDFIGSYMGEPAIFDVKSGFYGVKAGYQLAAYKAAYERMVFTSPNGGQNLGKLKGMRLVGLGLPWNKEMKAFEYQHEDFCWARFLDALGLFRGLNYHRLDKQKWKFLHVERDGTATSV